MEGVDDQDKAASVDVGATPRRATSSLDVSAPRSVVMGLRISDGPCRRSVYFYYGGRRDARSPSSSQTPVAAYHRSGGCHHCHRLFGRSPFGPIWHGNPTSALVSVRLHQRRGHPYSR